MLNKIWTLHGFIIVYLKMSFESQRQCFKKKKIWTQKFGNYVFEQK